jgi:hypothetical protein
MDISNKLSKVSDSFTINMYDNGFMIDISGRDHNDEWTSAKVICQNLEQVIVLVSEISTMKRDS